MSLHRTIPSPPRPRTVAAILFLCMFAAQSGQMALTPVLTDVAHAFGMPTAEAERRLHRHLRVGCETAIYLRSGRATLTVAFSGGRVQRDGTVIGGHVDAFMLHGLRHDPGVVECL